MAHRLDYSWLPIEYPDRGKQLYRKLIPLKGLLQKNYGKRLDCTLTSLACIFGEQYYSDIEGIALKYLYNGDKWGTNPLAVKAIMREFIRWRDGRGYYKDHSVTIIGAEEYEQGRFLLVLDNWHETVSLIDYDKLWIISSINWIDK